MAQMIYAVAAMVAVTIFAISTRHSGVQSENEIYIAEARSRMLGVAREAVERVTRQEIPFDAVVNPDNVGPYDVFPYVDSPTELTDVGSFGNSLCYADLSLCEDLDDYHDYATEGESNGIPFELTMEVSYVDTLTGQQLGNVKSYAKMLTATVTTTAVSFGGEPATVKYFRIFSYPTPFDFALGAESLIQATEP